MVLWIVGCLIRSSFHGFKTDLYMIPKDVSFSDVLMLCVKDANVGF
jgi:hypothetical protein